MMRDYNRVSGRFWSGQTGKQLRSLGRDHQVLAMYLISCPSTSWLGIYYLPLPTLCHEVGMTEERAFEVLADFADLDFAHYDLDTEFVWVPNMARWQIGERLKADDNQVKGIKRELQTLSEHPFAALFISKYTLLFHLNDVQRASQGPPKGWNPPTRPLRSRATATATEADTATEPATATAVGARPENPAAADPLTNLSPELAEAVALCREHPYLGEMLDPAVTLSELRAGYPDLPLVPTVRQARAVLTPERIDQQRAKHGPASRFLTSYFHFAERDRIREATGPSSSKPDDGKTDFERAAEAEERERLWREQDLADLRAEAGRKAS